MGKYFEALPFSNFLKQMVSGSKLKCPSKVSWEVSFSLYYSVICGNCLGNVVIGMEKCGKMCENVEKCGKCAGDPFLLYYFYQFGLKLVIINMILFYERFASLHRFACDVKDKKRFCIGIARDI